MDSLSLLTDAPVPPVPANLTWLRAVVARFSTGEDHERRRALVVEQLRRVDPAELREAARARPQDAPVAVLADALGLGVDPADVAAVAGAYQPHFPQSAAADAACARLVAALGGVPDERTAAVIGLLVQACDATVSLIRNAAAGSAEPPVPSTRRLVDGAEVSVDLRGAPFGAGPHACPGEAYARALAEGFLSAARGSSRR
ncbi:hypothetical protein [Amycolatopsis sp. FDAARGOS 1241]|uniref:hypothetical protein n=1 Tax=Amycolatopsis sp. FDAARGOS 1241 TaxID=2778070 RepID=UPI0019517F31|nr:hypothetical protein [Amycolatopsis sp. FDAARGOS 1241]QRP46871.1 hypothetical protein I6J71_02105 [Amycolatopsis sp. FDAARGOS 1241]